MITKSNHKKIKIKISTISMKPEDLKQLQQDIRDIKLDIAYIKQMLLALAKGPPRTETRWGWGWF